MDLPEHNHLPVHLLAACFNHTVTTYKFYWFLSLLKHVESDQSVISKHRLFADMVAHAWYTVNYFKISFGQQDKLQQAIENLKVREDLTIDAGRQAIYDQLDSTTNKMTLRDLRYFNGEVPHRFLSPWFGAENKTAAYAASRQFENQCLYALYTDHIEVNPEWAAYLKQHAGILRGFCYWHLTMYLQSKNPNVPDIPNKLIRTPVRKPLTEQRKFWDIVINELGSVDCIYTNQKLITGNYAVEHFLPYAFVSHDLMWNLIPADRIFNSSKSDKLPSLERYFEPYFALQSSAIEIINAKAPKNKFLEDYLTIVPDLSLFQKDRVFEQVQPLATIAKNNGFLTLM